MSVLYALENMRSPAMNYLWQGVTFLGDQTFLVIILAVMFWLFDEKAGYRAAFALLLGAWAVNIIKITLAVPRPWVLDPAFQAVASAISGATGYSFPSGHSQAAASLYVSFFLSARGKKRFALLLMPLAVGFSRLYLGVHTPADVLAGLAVGTATAVLAVFAEKKRGVFLHGFLIGLSLASLGYALAIASGHAHALMADIYKAAGLMLGFAVAAELLAREGGYQPAKLGDLRNASNFNMFLMASTLGLLGLVMLYTGTKLLFDFLFRDLHFFVFLRYALIPLYAIWLYPRLLKKWRG